MPNPVDHGPNRSQRICGLGWSQEFSVPGECYLLGKTRGAVVVNSTSRLSFGRVASLLLLIGSLLHCA